VELRDLRFAVTLSEELHFGRAARRLFIAEQAFGRRIRGLEREVGFAIFQRTSRSVAVTPAGAAFLREARHLLLSANDLTRPAAPPSSSLLRIGMLGFGAASLWPVMRQHLLDQHPALTIEFVDLGFDDDRGMLHRGEIDAAITQRFDGAVGIDFHTLFSSPRVLVVPENGPLARRDFVAGSELLGADWLGTTSEAAGVATWLGTIAGVVRTAPPVARPSAIPAAVATTGRLSIHCQEAQRFYPQPGVRFVATDGAPVEIALATRADDSRASIVALRAAATVAAA
jgi:DNA-binding transcriptional LysR family regulator